MTSPKPPRSPIVKRSPPLHESSPLSPRRQLPNIVAPSPSQRRYSPDILASSRGLPRRFPPTNVAPSLPTIESPPSDECRNDLSSSAESPAGREDNSTSYAVRRGFRSQGRKRNGESGLNEWVAPLLMFSFVCLGIMIATLVYCITMLDQYTEEELGVFFHVSDIHYDPVYRSMGQPDSLCHSGLKDEVFQPHGQNGCDSPLSLLRSAAERMGRYPRKADFIIVTGDSVAHNISSSGETIDALAQVDNELRSAFMFSHTKILYAVGVAELHPLSELGLPHSDWYSQLAAVWNDSLSKASDSAMETFKKGGYYVALLEVEARRRRHLEPANLAVIVLNTLYYSVDAEVTDDDDPGGQLEWLQGELRSARHWGRNILIAGHMPPGVNTVGGGPLWQTKFEEKYLSIILEHADIIVAQLFGYLHRDHFRLMRTPEVTPGDSLMAPSEGGDSQEDAADSSLFGQGNNASFSRVKGTSGELDAAFGSIHLLTGSTSNSTKGKSWRLRVARHTGSSTCGGDACQMAAVQSSSAAMLPSALGHMSRPHGIEADTGVYASRRRLLGVGAGSQPGVPVHREGGQLNGKVTLEGRPSTGLLKGRQLSGDIWRAVLSLARKSREAVLAKGAVRGQSRTPGTTKSAGSSILMVSALSPIYYNKPAFRVFRYDRWRQLLDYTEHTANLQEKDVTKLWAEQYTAGKMFSTQSLDTQELCWLSAAFFNASGEPTKLFSSFCNVRAAGAKLVQWADGYDCCEGCPLAMHCALDYSTYEQYLSCIRKRLP